VKLNQQQVQHLYWRAGFGPTYAEAKQAIGKSAEALTEEIFIQAEKSAFLKVVDEEKYAYVWLREYSQEEKMKLRAEEKKAGLALNLAWMQQLASTQTQLRQKMTLYRHGHLATSVSQP